MLDRSFVMWEMVWADATLDFDEMHGQEVDAMLVGVWHCFLNLCSVLSELKLE